MSYTRHMIFFFIGSRYKNDESLGMVVPARFPYSHVSCLHQHCYCVKGFLKLLEPTSKGFPKSGKYKALPPTSSLA